MRRRIGAIGAAALAAGLMGGARAGAATLCVAPGGAGGCFASVQAAVDAAASGDEIDIAAGTYQESLVVIRGKRVRLKGAGAGATLITGAQGALFVGKGARVVASAMELTTTATNVVAAVTVNGIPGRARLELEDCVVEGPGVAGVAGVRASFAGLEVRRCTISAPNWDGVAAGAKSRVRIERSTIAASGGGVDLDAGRVLVVDSTVTGNAAGIVMRDGAQRARLRVRSSTIAGNGSHAILSFSRGAIRVQGSIVSGLCDIQHPLARLVSLGGNVFSSDCVASRGRTAEDVVGVDPLLGPLQDNGGPTETMLPGPGSPALGLVGRRRPCTGTDQRGMARSLPCDAGAVEVP